MSSTLPIEITISSPNCLKGAFSCYANGEGTTKNSKKGFELYSNAAEGGDLDAQCNHSLCYLNGEGMTENSEKAFELYSKAAETGHLSAQYNLAFCYDNRRGMTKNSKNASREGRFKCTMQSCTFYLNGEGTTKNLEKAFKLFSEAAEVGHLVGGVGVRAYQLETAENLGKGENSRSQTTFELYLKAAEANNLCYQSDFFDLHVHDLTLKEQENLEYTILQFRKLDFKYLDYLKGEFLDFEAFFDQLSDEFKCLKCGNLGTIISGSPICPFCDTDKRDNIRLPKCLECDGTLKNSLWCKSCKYLRLLKSCGTWNSGNDNIDQYINHTQKISESCGGFLEWISPDEITFLDRVGTGGFGIVKEVALKCLKGNQNMECINSDKFLVHLTSASCKYILECYGITKDVTNNEFDMFLRILFQIAGGLRFIHESKLVHGDLHPENILALKTTPLKVVISDLGLCHPADDTPQFGKIYGVLEYLAPKIFEEDSHTKPFNNTDPINVVHNVIKGKRPTIKKHTPQCIQEIIKKNWHCNPQYRNTAEQLQQRVIAAHYNCNLNELVYEKRFYSEEIKDAQHDETRYKSQHISNFTCSMSGETFIYNI
ncbi:hypothetical protein G9A89_008486 [Geosiphon pyriformis]|nr:hypothetical protein G9A89_008486 [Geosiphon pyriformis]